MGVFEALGETPSRWERRRAREERERMEAAPWLRHQLSWSPEERAANDARAGALRNLDRHSGAPLMWALGQQSMSPDFLANQRRSENVFYVPEGGRAPQPSFAEQMLNIARNAWANRNVRMPQGD